MVCGGLIVSYFADRNGRRLCLLLGALITGISVLCVGISPKIEFIFGLLATAGAGFSSLEIVSMVYASEISGKRFRNHSAVALVTVWGVSQVLLGFIYPLVNNWRYIFIYAIAVPCLLSAFLVYWLFDESPRFLAVNQNFDVAFLS